MKKNKIMICMWILLILGIEMFSNARLNTIYAKASDRENYGSNNIYNTYKDSFAVRELTKQKLDIEESVNKNNNFSGSQNINILDSNSISYKKNSNVKQQSSMESVTVPVYFSSPPTLDSSWTVFDETTTSGIYLNSEIQRLIGLGNRKFYIKNGVYHLNDSIPITESDVIIQGESRDHTMLIQDKPGANSVEITKDNVEISEITLDGTIGRRVFNCKDVNQVTIKDCILRGGSGNPVIDFGGRGTGNDITAVTNGILNEGNKIENNEIYANAIGSGDAVFFNNQNNGIISGNYLSGGRLAFYLSTNSTVSGNTIENSEEQGILCTLPASANTISNNTIKNTKSSGIAIVRSDPGVTLDSYRAGNFTIQDNKITDSRYFGIEISCLENSTIQSNILTNMDFNGIYLLYSDYLSIISNKINESNRLTVNPSIHVWIPKNNSAIYGQDKVTNCTIKLNELNNNLGVCPYGIRFETFPQNHDNVIVGNQIKGYFEYSMSVQGGSTATTRPAVDGWNDVGANPEVLQVKPPPTNIKAIPDMNWIDVSWDAVSGVMGYYIEVDGVLNSNILTSTSYRDNSLLSGTTHTYRVKAKGGDWGSVTAKTLDTPIPTTPVLTPDTTAITGGNVTVTIDNWGDAVLLKYSIDGGSWQDYATPIVVTTNCAISAQGWDAAGNSSNVAVLTINNIDKEGPSTPILNPDITTPTNGNVTVTIINWGDAVVKKYSTDGGLTWSDYGTDVIVTSNCTVQAKGKDAVGNWSSVGTVSISNIDTTPPPNPTLVPSTTAITNTDVIVTITDWGDAVVEKYSTDGGATWQDYVTPVAVTTNGAISAKGQDAAGNWSGISSITISNIDKEPPTTPVITPNITTTTSGSVTVSIGSWGDATVRKYSIDGGTSWQDYSGPVEMTNNGVILAKGQDAVGNWSGVGSITIENIDRIPPTTPTFIPSIITATNSNVIVTITNWGDAVVKKYSTDGEVTWQDYIAPVVVTTNGAISAKGQDSVGNWSGVGSIVIDNIDRIPPTTPTFIPSTTTATNGNVTVTITNWGDAVIKKYSTDGGSTWQDYVAPVVVTTNCAISARGEDAAGNQSDIAVLTINNIDKEPPTTPVLTADITTTTNGNVTVTISNWGDAVVKKYSIDGGITWQNYGTAVVVTSNCVVEAKGQDALGNWSSIGSISINNIYSYIPINQPENREVSVVIGDGSQQGDLVPIAVTVVTNNDGSKTDSVKLDENIAEAIVKKAAKINTTSAAISLVGIAENEETAADIEISKTAAVKLGEGNIKLGINTEKVKVEIPGETLGAIKDKDVHIVVEKVKDSKEIEKTKGVLFQMAAKGRIIWEPTIISTNYTGKTKVTIPIESSKLPKDRNELQEFVASLAVLVQHYDKKNDLQKGIVEYDKDGNPVSISIWVEKFSTFTLVSIPFEGRTVLNDKKQMPDKELMIKFTKEIDKNTINEQNVYVLDSKGSLVDVQLQCEGNILRIKPMQYYIANGAYDLYIRKNVQSSEGKLIKKAIKYEFTIGDIALPGRKVKEYRDIPSDKEWTAKLTGAIDEKAFDRKCVKVVDENCNEIEVEVAITDNRFIKVKPKKAYEKGKTYYLIIDGIKSESGIAIKQAAWFKFTITKE